MQTSNITFKGIKFDKTVPNNYKKTILENPEILKAGNDLNLRVSLRDAHSEIDHDSWRILKFQIYKKGIAFWNKLNSSYKTIVSSKMSDEDILESVKKIEYKDFKS